MSKLLIIYLSIFSTLSLFSQEINFNIDSIDIHSNLTIWTYIHDESDCGEFGGHKEIITINCNKNSDKYIIHQRFPSDCNSINYFTGLKDNTIIQNKLVLEEKDLIIIKSFIASLLSFKTNPNVISNAQDTYEIQFKNNYYKVVDELGDWTGYKDFREYILYTATANKK